MKNEDREFLMLRQKTLEIMDILSKISQASWRYKKTKETYSLDNYSGLFSMYIEFGGILVDLMSYMKDNEETLLAHLKYRMEYLSQIEKEDNHEN